MAELTRERHKNNPNLQDNVTWTTQIESGTRTRRVVVHFPRAHLLADKNPRGLKFSTVMDLPCIVEDDEARVGEVFEHPPSMCCNNHKKIPLSPALHVGPFLPSYLSMGRTEVRQRGRMESSCQRRIYQNL